MTSPHAPVLLAEVIEALNPQPGDVVIDATFGAGGYTRAILDRGAQVIGLDRDPTVQPHADAVAAAYPGQFQLIRTPFSGLSEAFADSGEARLDGVVFDIGVSSMQLDQAERGFSFMRDGPLDMRMGDTGPTAADIVNTWDHGPMAHIFKQYGDERQSGRVATAILRRRVEKPFERTLDLAAVVEKALLLPVVALVAWTMVMWTWMYVTRIPAIRAANMKLDPHIARGEQMASLPAPVRWKADNYNHLMEQPTQFYAVTLALALAGGAAIDVYLAWAYVGLRVVHSVFQSTVNKIEVRFTFFALSSFVLIGLTVRAVLALV